MRANSNGRDRRGRFASGNPGGPGRPPIARERKYLETLTKACTLKDWKEICRRAVEDAKKGDYRARDWLCKYIIGAPATGGKNGAATCDGLAVENGGNKYVGAPADLILDAMEAMAKLEEYRESKGR